LLRSFSEACYFVNRFVKTADYLARNVLAAGDGRDEQDTVTVFDGAGFAAEEADVFIVEINVEELANLALVVADVAAEIGKFSGQLIQGFGDCDGATVHLGLAVGEATEGRWDFYDYWHVSCSLSFHLDICCKRKL
jgi:hypothetical protein